MNYKELGKRIAFFREQQGMSQKILADALGVSLVTIINYERGVSKIQALQLLSLCKHIGVDISELLQADAEDNATELLTGEARFRKRFIKNLYKLDLKTRYNFLHLLEKFNE